LNFKGEINMKKVGLGLAAIFVLSLAAIAAPKESTFKGEIMDSACAKAGSHDGMMKQAGLKTAKDCTEACVKGGSKYVLFNKSSKKVYQLDDQSKPQQFAGQTVSVKGTLDGDTIHINSIK
jgi:type 1 fimbria pilin